MPGIREVHVAPVEPDLTNRFAELLEALPDGVAVTTPAGRIVAVNNQLCAMSGYARDELIGSAIERFIPARFRAEHVAQRTAYVAEGAPMRSMSARPDIVLVCADGRELPVDISLSSTGEEDDRVIVASVRDASARRAADLARDREYRFLSAMSDITSALFSTGDVDETFRAVTRHARHLVDADVAWLVVPDGDNAKLAICAADGFEAVMFEGSVIPSASSIAGVVIREHEPVLIPDMGTDPSVHRESHWPGDLGPGLIVPLHAREETLGSLTMVNRRGRDMFTLNDITFMRAFGLQAAIALLDARRQLQLRRLEVLEDRERVAGELHDSVINRISRASLKMHAVLESTLTEAQTDRLWDAVEELDAAIAAIRSAVFPR